LRVVTELRSVSVAEPPKYGQKKRVLSLDRFCIFVKKSIKCMNAISCKNVEVEMLLKMEK